MKGLKDTEELDKNMVEMDTAVFAKDYNDTVPEAFPRATVRTLEIFQETYPSLFKRKKLWTIDKHRKKVMDWLASYSKTISL